jgi:Tol biopolymer transport system component
VHDRPPALSGAMRRIWIPAAVILVVLFAVLIWSRTRTTPRTLVVSSERPIAAFGGSYRHATLSPDGGFIAFSGASDATPQIWIKNLAQGDPIRITTGPAAASDPTWSPKNDQIVFARRGQGLWSVPPLGGDARRLLDFGTNPAFSPDGERLVFVRDAHQIWTVRADGSDARGVQGVQMSWYPGDLDPAFSPDGRSIVYFMPEIGPNGDLWVVPSAGGAPRQLTHDLTEAGGPVWTADGRFIIFSSIRGGSRTLWRVDAAGGTPEPLTVGAGEDLEPALSRDGRTLVYTNVHNEFGLRAFDSNSGTQHLVLQRRRQTIFPRISPDGSTVAFFGFGDSGDVQVFAAPLGGGGEVRQVTRDQGINAMPQWSRDGSHIYYYAYRPTPSFRSIPVSGGASSEIRPWRWEAQTHAEFSPDGSLIAYHRQAGPGENGVVERTVIEDVRSGAEHALALSILPPQWSPDGRTIVGHTTAGPPTVAVCPVDGGACRRLAPGRNPKWSANGSLIYFLRDTQNPATKELWSMSADGANQRLVLDRIGPFRTIDVTFDVSRDGQMVWSEFIEGRHELWQAALRP